MACRAGVYQSAASINVPPMSIDKISASASMHAGLQSGLFFKNSLASARYSGPAFTRD
jgi:hypothetical protein